MTKFSAPISMAFLLALLVGAGLPKNAAAEAPLCYANELYKVGSVDVLVQAGLPDLIVATEGDCASAVTAVTIVYQGKLLHADSYMAAEVAVDREEFSTSGGIPADFRQLAKPFALSTQAIPAWAAKQAMFDEHNLWTELDRAAYTRAAETADEVVCFPVHYETFKCVGVNIEHKTGVILLNGGA